MYRLSFTKLLNATSTIFSKNHTSALSNIQKFNGESLHKLHQNFLLGTTTSLSTRHFSHNRTNSKYEEPLSILARVYKEQGRVYAPIVLNIINQWNPDVFSNDQGFLILQCCGQVIVDKAPSVRSTICNQAWAKLKESNISLNLLHYNKYLEICIENRDTIDYKGFISTMQNCQPNEETYLLLLLAVCQLGDVVQAVNLITEMKDKNFPAGESVFNALVLGNAIHGGLNDAKNILNTMQTARVSPTSLTYSYLLRGLAEHSNLEEFLEALRLYPDETNEDELLKLFQSLGLHGNHKWSEEVLHKIQSFTLSQNSLAKLKLICIHLVHMEQPEAAFYYYKNLVLPYITKEKLEDTPFLFIEMLYCKMPTKTVIELIQSISESDQSLLIQKLTELALKKGLTEAAMELFTQLPCLRPHYFWPLLVRAASTQRERGVFSIIHKMIEFGVKPDTDTLEYYVVPFCDTSDSKNLLLRLKSCGFTYRELLTPILVYLLREKQLSAAERLCSINENIPIEADNLIQPLCKAWINTKDSKSTVILLKRLLDAKGNTDPIGKFLLQLLKACQSPADYHQYLHLIKDIQDHNIKISVTFAESICYYLKSINHRTVSKSVQIAIKSITDDSLNNTYTLIPHPRNMSASELENHLLELQNKGMETRGVLRKLIQEHCRLGNETRVNELRQQFLDAGYNETAGMKASLFHTYVIKGNPSGAQNIYNEIKLKHSKFALDDFKIIDFATLLIQHKQFDAAVDLLSKNPANIGGAEIIRNCWRLLSAIDDEDHLEYIYKLLVERGYCIPSNIVLGPFVKLQIKRGNLQKAVEVYTQLAEKHRSTPLQVELLLAVLEAENDVLLRNILDVTGKIYGSDAAAVGFISALSQSGLTNSLQKFLLESSVSSGSIIKLCERWLESRDTVALETLANGIVNIPPEKFNASIVYNFLIKMYGIKNDCDSAVKFYRRLLDLKVPIPPEFTQELLSMVHRCNYVMPDNILEKQAKL